MIEVKSNAYKLVENKQEEIQKNWNNIRKYLENICRRI